MLISGLVALGLGIAMQADTVLVLGAVERDLTGDSKPEVLRLVAVGQSIDSLEVTFSIEGSGQVLFRARLAPLTRTLRRLRRLARRARGRSPLSNSAGGTRRSAPRR